ncbi:MAG: glucosaminidase domain-containing protein [Gammaproteobacteria bacterium]
MRFGRLRNFRASAAPARILTTGALAVLLCVTALFAVLTYSPQRSGDQLPDFRPLETQLRKAEFFAFLDPIVADVTAEVSAERAFILEAAGRLETQTSLSWLTRRKLGRIAQYYEVETEDADLTTEVLPALQRRVDIVPRSLVFVQAAKESGWGTSRFAREGNNLFGQRCYSVGCGIAPAGIQPGAKFGIARFDTVGASVTSYVRNLNTHPLYEDFRRLRQSLRESDAPLTGTALADSLIHYSERGEAYVAEIKSLIRQNALEPHD